MMPVDSFISVYLFSFGMAIAAVLTPGPVTTAIVSQSPRLGWATGPLVSIGHAVTEFLMVVLITIGLSGVLGAPAVQHLIALLGGLLLLWMGGGMVQLVLKGRMRLPRGGDGEEPASIRQMLTLGVVASVTNPFWYAWWMTAAAVFLLQAKSAGWPLVAGFYLGHVSADFLWNTALSAVIGSGRKLFTDRTYGLLIGACGLFLVYLAVKFLMAGIHGFTA